MAGRELQEYGDAGYWDERYAQNTAAFDWYQRYSGLKPLVDKYIPKSSKILMPGCGNALASEEMVKDGFEDILNIDVSTVVVDAMKKKYAAQPQLQYLTMDVREMVELKDGTFDAVIDKGLLDSLLCGSSAQTSAAKMLAEVCRVLRPGGVYMLVTHAEPTQRLTHLRQPDLFNWTISLHVVPKPGCKSKQADPKNKWDSTELVPLPEEVEGDTLEQPVAGKDGKSKDGQGEGKKDGKGEGGKKGDQAEAKNDGKGAPSDGKKEADLKTNPQLPGSREGGDPPTVPEPRTYLHIYGQMDVHYVYVCIKERGSSKGKDSKAGKDAKKGDGKAAKKTK